eukprot:8322336-Pyramimonas_sp.AAC.1
MPSATPAEDRTPATRTCGRSDLAVFHGSRGNGMPFQAALRGPLPGQRQTAARGERLALVIAVGATKQDIVYFTDNQGCYLGCNHVRAKEPTGQGADLGLRLQRAEARRQ